MPVSRNGGNSGYNGTDRSPGYGNARHNNNYSNGARGAGYQKQSSGRLGGENQPYSGGNSKGGSYGSSKDDFYGSSSGGSGGYAADRRRTSGNPGAGYSGTGRANGAGDGRSTGNNIKNERYVTSRRREYIDPAYGIYDDTYKRRNTSSGGKGKKKARKPRVKPELILLAAVAVAIIVLLILAISFVSKLIGKSGGTDSDKTPGTSAPAEVTSAPDTDGVTEPIVIPGDTGNTGNTSGNGFYEVPNVSFTADLSAYEKYMNPENRDGYLILVNAKKTLSSDYVPKNLVNLDKSMLKNSSSNVQMVSEAANALTALFTEMKANGYTDVKVTNAYRSYEYQTWLFGYWKEHEQEAHPDWTAKQVEELVLTYSNREGTSEHQSGLCCDMHNMPETSWEKAKEFADSPSGSWLIENCWKFGFILRFPDGKQEECLGVRYESWHYRYVGRYHAYQMKMLDMCLEEYIQYLETHTPD